MFDNILDRYDEDGLNCFHGLELHVEDLELIVAGRRRTLVSNSNLQKNDLNLET